MKKVFFLITIKEATGKIRLRAISGQNFGSSLDPVLTHLNVSGSTSKRSEYPLGTIFGCYDLQKSKGCYKIPDFNVYPLVLPDGRDVGGAKVDALDAYKKFKAGGKKVSTMPEEKSDVENTEIKAVEDTPPPTYLERIKRNIDFLPPSIEDDGYYVDPDDWYFLITNVKRRENTIVLGDSGTGKTTLIYHLATKLKKELAVFDMGAMKDALTGLLGTHRIVDGKSIFDYSRFYYAVQKPGFITLDEISRAPASSNNILFPCLDFRRTLPVEIAASSGERNAPVHKDVVFFSTANIGVEYTGTSVIDRALMERFVPLELSYLPEDIERKVLEKVCKIDFRNASSIMSVIKTLRNLYRDEKISVAPSIRHSKKIATMVVDGFSVKTALEKILFPLFEGSKTSGERSVVASTITSK